MTTFAEQMVAAFHWCPDCGAQLNRRTEPVLSSEGATIVSGSKPARCPMCGIRSTEGETP